MNPDTIKPLNIVFHAGAHKTATTHLQQLLGRNAPALREQGRLFLGPKNLRRHKGGLNRALGLMPGLDRNQTLSDLMGECDHLIASEENFMGLIVNGDGALANVQLYPNAVHRLTNLALRLAPHQLHLTFAMRHPATFITSAYSQAMLKGHYRPWKEFIADVRLPNYSWADLIVPLARSGVFASVTTWAFEDYDAVFDQVLDTMIGPDRPEFSEAVTQKSHVGLSDRAVQACAKWYGAGQRGPLGSVAREDFPVSDQHPKFQPWTKRQLDHADAIYAKDKKRILATEGVTVLQPAAAKG